MTRSPVDRRAPRQMSYWLWMLVVAMVCVIGVFVVANSFLPVDRAVSRAQLGQDFLAFYSAGRLVNDGQPQAMYDLAALGDIQHSIAAESNLTLASDVAPWWNPPFAAWLFAPLASLPFNTALIGWTLFNIAALTTASWMLSQVIRGTSERRRDWLLVPALLFVAPPTWQALGHGQNTGVSLLLMTATVLAWRARRPLVAGVAWSLLCYKPQLAGVAGIAMFATLGWRFAVGAMLGLVPLLLLTVNTMPEALEAFLTRMPENLAHFQQTHPPLWHRHATIEGFIHSLAARNGFGDAKWLSLVSPLSIVAALALLARAWRRLRSHELASDEVAEVALDRFIALSILVTPLAVPYFVDYDLLILAIPGVLVAREMMLTGDASPAARWLRRLGPLLFVWLAANPPLAEATGLSVTVPLLAILIAMQARRCMRAPSISIPTTLTATFQDAPSRLAA